MRLALRSPDAVSAPDIWRRGEPLWKSVPTRDMDGVPLSDFMMIAPGLKRRAPEEINAVLSLILGVLERFQEFVVFADFNLSLNLLWVSLRSRHGVMSLIVAALRAKVPSLKLVGHNPIDGHY